MRDHYGPFSHPVLVDLPVQPTLSFFDEMSLIADELRTNPDHIPADDKCAFRQLQRIRRPDLRPDEWQDLFETWRDQYRARKDESDRAVDRFPRAPSLS